MFKMPTSVFKIRISLIIIDTVNYLTNDFWLLRIKIQMSSYPVIKFCLLRVGNSSTIMCFEGYGCFDNFKIVKLL